MFACTATQPSAPPKSGPQRRIAGIMAAIALARPREARSRSPVGAKETHWVKLVDVGTQVSEQEEWRYTEFLRKQLECEEVRISSKASNSGGQHLVHLQCKANISRLAVTRAKIRERGWTIVWLDDAKAAGITK